MLISHARHAMVRYVVKCSPLCAAYHTIYKAQVYSSECPHI